MLFKNRKLEVKLVKDETPTINDTLKTKSSEELVAIATDLTKRIVVGVVVVIAVSAVAAVASEIAVAKIK